jgi:hypothetical protein
MLYRISSAQKRVLLKGQMQMRKLLSKLHKQIKILQTFKELLQTKLHRKLSTC